ncbi:MAG TPA: ATP synthase F1 subunit gamma [Gemmataceae bacterium]|jgi:F-type H+-transporting ATPase subunit gamma
MANTRELVKRRKAIRNIRKITRTMELIATAQFRKALDRAVSAEAYTKKIAELAADLSANAGEIKHPLLTPHAEVKNGVLLVLTSNRGLAGGYNGSILRVANERLREYAATGITPHLEVSGKRAIIYYRFQRVATEQAYTHLQDKPNFHEVEKLANRYIADYGSGKIDRVDVAYMKFINAARQTPVVETLLPLTAAPGAGAASGSGAKSKVEYEFVPDAAGILEEILPVSFKVRLFKCFLDAAVSEQIARRVAMKAATENADEIIKAITQEYNRARQAKITKELAEIIGGAAALE